MISTSQLSAELGISLLEAIKEERAILALGYRPTVICGVCGYRRDEGVEDVEGVMRRYWSECPKCVFARFQSTPSAHLVVVDSTVFGGEWDPINIYAEVSFAWCLANRGVVEDDGRVFIGF